MDKLIQPIERDYQQEPDLDQMINDIEKVTRTFDYNKYITWSEYFKITKEILMCDSK